MIGDSEYGSNTDLDPQEHWYLLLLSVGETASKGNV